MIECLLILRDKDSIEAKNGLGVHQFARIPIVGEFISLSSDGAVYKATHVHHTGFGMHKAEIYVIEADDIEIRGGLPLPMP